MDTVTNTPDTHGQSDELLAGLLARGIVTTSPCGDEYRVTRLPAAERSFGLRPTASARLHIAVITQFLTALCMVALQHSDARLIALVDWIHRRQAALCRRPVYPDTKTVARLLSRFFRLRLWFYTADQHCLFDSLVLATFLTRHGIPCHFCIGVSTKPFVAHAWVQRGDLVLNDTAEHVNMFTPILVVGSNNGSATCFNTL